MICAVETFSSIKISRTKKVDEKKHQLPQLSLEPPSKKYHPFDF